ncbi:DUF4145 domain-containing protein [Paenibacillus sp. BAC0078]
MINDIEEFKNKVVTFHITKIYEPPEGDEPLRVTVSQFPMKEEIHCSMCGDARKNEIQPLSLNNNFNDRYFEQLQISLRQKKQYYQRSFIETVYTMLFPSFWKCRCLQCDSISYIVLYKGPRSFELLILPSSEGGITTPNTPKNVSFYLDQANRAHIMGASSAAMAMYRTAIEQILVGEGYTVRMLGPKIQNLIKDIENSTGPKWASDIDVDFLQYIKKLGDSAIHANDGDIDRQKNLDNELIISVKEAISFLLYAIYESAHKKKTLLEGLKSTLESMR